MPSEEGSPIRSFSRGDISVRWKYLLRYVSLSRAGAISFSLIVSETVVK
ncbi:hypothetical protein PORCRE_389 [Porphyromonas crevioricanis JCM 15906]|uniref:Uncharacterized protein n=1 Tax=Porphyromonas crevioricanis JCM 15906 TaxID=1305617 RepID=S4NG65_9PORP|nr:hypothetical protein PORCRE_389 [Porphyromonas crevioricanis JCM 15906]GAD08033.1 hypothetical protein PORCAN_1663 [Porphyromonas crevioricanis JCM 13913]